MNYLISANWKMNGDKAFVKSYLSSVNIEEDPEVQMLICPPDCYLQEMDTNASQIVSRGAQNLSFNSNGAYTGEVSVEMLHDHNVQYVIVGHSERRQFHSETNEIVAKKFKTAIDNDIIPILCVGESLEQRKSGDTYTHLREQIQSVITETMIHSDKQFVVAYEPIWAIGTGETATPELANESHIFIKDTINEICPSNEHNVVIIYGGSVNSSNATDLFKMSHINGALIGGASLDVNEFIKIFNIAKEINHE